MWPESAQIRILHLLGRWNEKIKKKTVEEGDLLKKYEFSTLQAFTVENDRK